MSKNVNNDVSVNPLIFIRIDKGVLWLTDHPENNRISFHMNYLQRYSALSC